MHYVIAILILGEPRRKENLFANIYICGPFFKNEKAHSGPEGLFIAPS